MSANQPSKQDSRDGSWNDPAPAPSGADKELTVAISERIVRLYIETFGRGPSRTRTFVQPEFAVCVLRDVLTTVERSSLASGGAAEVEASRARINQANDAQYLAIVEEETGRTVLSHLARTRVSTDVAVHFYLFDDGSHGSDHR